MKATIIPVTDIDSYISNFPADVKEKLEKLRQTIRKSAPAAQEVISYQMPAYKLNGILVYFAGYKKHIGFYPGASAIKTFAKEIAVYKWAKGSIQFPLDKPLPLALVGRIVKFRVKEDAEKATAKKKK